MITRNSAGLYPWSKDLEASSDVRLREREGFAMLLGWLDKFVAGSGSSPGREVCERFWKEHVWGQSPQSHKMIEVSWSEA
jgi:hypothetical protein